jgi:hypothetical protein
MKQAFGKTNSKIVTWRIARSDARKIQGKSALHVGISPFLA